MLCLPHGGTQPGWLGRPLSCFTAFTRSTTSFFHSLSPTALPTHMRRSKTEHNAVHVQQPPHLSSGSTCYLPAQQLRPTLPERKKLVVSCGEQKLQVSPLEPLFCCLCQLPSSISLACVMCFSQPLDETPGTAGATLRLVCPVQCNRSTFFLH